jgi:DNA-binding HxlR family transcriptional regulator
MNRGYGQYCPLSLAAELLCERWTLLIVSRIIDGCTQFNSIHRGLPRIAPAMLAKRLDELERAGIITRPSVTRGTPRTYHLTEAGTALEPIVMQMAVWGQHWARDMRREDLDPGFLAWSMHTRMDTERLPPGRTVIQFEFSGAPSDCRHFWLVAQDQKVDMCVKDPGYEVDVLVRSDLQRFVEAWRGFRNLRAEIRSGNIEVIGARALVRQFPDWLRLSMLAPYERKRPGRERSLACGSTSIQNSKRTPMPGAFMPPSSTPMRPKPVER